jgi:hypothetical protein
VCNRSIVFAIDVTGDILAIFINVIGVVNIAAGFAVITGALISFTWNVSLLPVSSVFASALTITAVVTLVTLLVVAGVVVSGHF